MSARRYSTDSWHSFADTASSEGYITSHPAGGLDCNRQVTDSMHFQQWCRTRCHSPLNELHKWDARVGRTPLLVSTSRIGRAGRARAVDDTVVAGSWVVRIWRSGVVTCRLQDTSSRRECVSVSAAAASGWPRSYVGWAPLAACSARRGPHACRG